MALLASAQDSHDGHDHGADGTKGWEWIGAFDLHEVAEGTGKMSLVLSQKDGKYADESMNILYIKASTADAEGIHNSEAEAEKLFKNSSTFIHVEPNEAATKVLLPGRVYKLEVDTAKKFTTFTLGGITEDANHKANYILFTQHVLDEFEGEGGHFLQDSAKKDIEAKVTEPEHKDHGNDSTKKSVSIVIALLSSALALW
jgi:hypothetical protein